jgi:Golgin subfamily A member 5
MDREREAEDRLDEALSLHARQISQRQSREAELERTVSELGSALVIARTKLSSYGKDHHDSGNNNNSNDSNEAAGSPQVQVEALQQELEVLTAQLTHEQQRCQALQNELRDISKERTEEASSSHSNQIHNDRKIAELSHTVARLESELLNAARNRNSSNGGSSSSSSNSGFYSSNNNTHDGSSGGGEELKQIKYLSEEVLRHREQLSSCNSEISALKSRLHVANARASKAEAALEEVENGNSFNGGGGAGGADSWSDVEMAPLSGNNNSMRRRGGGGRRSPTHRTVPTMRSALHLGPGQSTEKIGKALDGIDVFLVESGKFLRYNPLARLLFIVYLLILHLWTFALFFFYAHGFETVHGDFGAGHGVPHGPHALMEQHPALQQAASSVAVSAAGQPVVAAAAAVSNVTVAAG